MFGQRVFLFASVAISAFGQARIAPEHSRRLEVTLQESIAKQTLPCDAEASRPFLDFAFRFEIGYVVHCPLKEFGGVETSIAAHMRVQAGDAPPVWFSEWYHVPGMPDDLRSRINLQHDHNDIEFSGVIAVGEGEYSVDLVVADRQHRLFHRDWKTKAFSRGADLRAPLSMQPNTIAALDIPNWSRTASERNLGRLTILVDAAPIRAGSTRLRAWDQAFLTEALSSVLTLLPSNSARVVAFNLDQQRQVFEADEFNPQETHRLSDSLRELELSKVSYEVLQQTHGAGNMLLDLLKRERQSERAADAIILLGPANRLSDKIPSESVDRHPQGPPVFYLKYSPTTPARLRLPFSSLMGMHEDPSTDLANLELGNGGEFPDIIQHAAAIHDGLTINLHSPADLADALRRIEHRLRPGAQPSADLER